MFKAIYRGNNKQGFGFGRQYTFECVPVADTKGFIRKQAVFRGFVLQVVDTKDQLTYKNMREFIADWREIEVVVQ